MILLNSQRFLNDIGNSLQASCVLAYFGAIFAEREKRINQLGERKSREAIRKSQPSNPPMLQTCGGFFMPCSVMRDQMLSNTASSVFRRENSNFNTLKNKEETVITSK
jgi:hypothetical protein